MSGQYPNTFYRVAVKALIRNDKGEVLLVKEKSDKWDLPGGGLDHNEEPEAGLKREILEELGIDDITVGSPLLVKSFWVEKKQAWLMWVVYNVEVHNDQFTPGEGIVAVDYLQPSILSRSRDERERFIPYIASFI